MAYLIDTNIAIHARDGCVPVLRKLAQHSGQVLLSALSLAELQRGLYRDPALASLRQVRLETLIEAIQILPFDGAAARAYGRILAQRAWVRSRDFDRLIAAHAISSRCVLVTNNVADFHDIPGLAIENWAAEP